MQSEAWWCPPLVPELGRQRQVNLYESEGSLMYRELQDSYRETPCLVGSAGEKDTKRELEC